MGSGLRLRAAVTALAASMVLVGLWAASGSVASAPRSCESFPSQADAQSYFQAMGGSPSRAVGKLDPDRDGVACEGLHRPYAGYATIGYNRAKGFLYGTATMPARAGKGYACLFGNSRTTNGLRRVEVLRGDADSGKPLAGDDLATAEAKPSAGRLLWKLDRPTLPRGTYYARFQGRFWPHPYGSSECPSFSSRPVELPVPRRGS